MKDKVEWELLISEEIERTFREYSGFIDLSGLHTAGKEDRTGVILAKILEQKIDRDKKRKRKHRIYEKSKRKAEH